MQLTVESPSFSANEMTVSPRGLLLTATIALQTTVKVNIDYDNSANPSFNRFKKGICSGSKGSQTRYRDGSAMKNPSGGIIRGVDCVLGRLEDIFISADV